MIEIEKWDALQNETVDLVHSRQRGLCARRPETKYVRRVFRIFDPDIKIVGDGSAKVHIAFVLDRQTSEVWIEALFNQTQGYALAFDEMKAAFENHRHDLAPDLDFSDPADGNDNRNTQQKIIRTLGEIDFQKRSTADLDQFLADAIEEFYLDINRINSRARQISS